MIIIGAEFNGPELSGTPVDKAIRAVMKAEAELNCDFQEGSMPAVNLVFCVAGSLGRPDWEHSQIGKYSAKSKLLLVQSAVPPDVVYSKAALDYVIGELYRANANAFEFYRGKGMQYPLAEAERLVARIRELAAQLLRRDDRSQS
jgi:hypothetical protein